MKIYIIKIQNLISDFETNCIFQKYPIKIKPHKPKLMTQIKLKTHSLKLNPKIPNQKLTICHRFIKQ